ncbi:hydrolase [Methylobacter sp. BlB1]|uniref:hydrolase n=1 Tax=Methylobacter sp. BlB1 TaxID=2785914 RepID=UPI0018954E7B|nr:hydrolase [Methylobacter sp. BlB1]MBF6650069.1 hydrolase [Methylobacter sp. BlB1]
MQSFIFIDLDDTLFQTLRKCGPLADRDGLQPRAYLKDGSPLSYATPKQAWLWQWLSGAGRMIPVTARDFDAFSRVDLPFTEEAVLNHGAVILDKNRRIDPEWQGYMADVLPGYHRDLFDLWEQVHCHARRDPALNPRLIKDFGVTWYGVIKHAAADEVALDRLLSAVIRPHESVLSGRLYYHLNGNNLAVLPDVVGKARAVGFLKARYADLHGPIVTIGMGDSKTDLPFMSLCDYAMIPNGTQLGRLFHDA